MTDLLTGEGGAEFLASRISVGPGEAGGSPQSERPSGPSSPGARAAHARLLGPRLTAGRRCPSRTWRAGGNPCPMKTGFASPSAFRYRGRTVPLGHGPEVAQ